MALLAERRYGWFTHTMARQHGYREQAIDLRVELGRWVHPRRGLYGITGVPDSFRRRVMAAVLAADELAGYPSDAQASRGAALADGGHALAGPATSAFLHGLRGAARPPTIDLVVAWPRRPRMNGVAVAQLRDLHASDRTVVHGVPCLDGRRLTIERASRCERRSDVYDLVDEMLCSGLGDRATLHRRASDLAGGRRYVALVRDVTAPGAERVFRSRLERDGTALIDQGDLPPHEVNVVLRDRWGSRIREVDVLWRDDELVVEWDGLRFHSSRAQRERDRAGDRRLALQGYRVLRYGWSDVHHRREAVVAELRAALSPTSGG